MAKGKEYTTVEVEEIISLYKDGLSYKEIADLTGRTKDAVRGAISRFYHGNGYQKTSFNIDKPEAKKEETKNTDLFNQTEEVKQVVEKMTQMTSPVVAEPAPIPASVVEKTVYKEKTLADFTERQIIKHLWDRGYRWENLYCLVKQKVNLDDIIKNG